MSTRNATPLADSLDAAWAEAEAALPEGWIITETYRVRLGGLRDMDRWGAAAAPRHPKGRNWRGLGDLQYADGPTPAAALLALAERLRERKA